MKSQRKLIVSADDFGMSAGINAGILRAHQDGILTDAALMITGAARDAAVAMARDTPSLSVGLHLVLVQGRAVSPPSTIPDLVDSDGYFTNNPIYAGFRYFFHPAARKQLRTEIRAQIEAFLATGIPLSHVDGHLNIHMHPTVLPILLELADELGIGAMRLAREALLPALRYDTQHLLRKTLEAVAFSALSRFAEPRFRAQAIRHPRTTYGLHQTGRITEDYLLHVIPALPPGISEVYCHAGQVDEEARRWRPADYQSEAEIEALASAKVREALQTNNIELTSYGRLTRVE